MHICAQEPISLRPYRLWPGGAVARWTGGSLLAVDVLPQYRIDQRVEAASFVFVELSAKPLENVVIQANGDLGFAFGVLLRRPQLRLVGVPAFDDHFGGWFRFRPGPLVFSSHVPSVGSKGANLPAGSLYDHSAPDGPQPLTPAPHPNHQPNTTRPRIRRNCRPGLAADKLSLLP